MGETENQKGKITLGLITSWGLGVLFLLASVAAFADPALVGAAIPFLIVAVLLLPPIRSFVHRKAGKSLSTGVRVVLVLIFMAVGTVAASPDTNLSASGQAAQSTPSSSESDTVIKEAQKRGLDKDISGDIKTTIMERCKTDAGEYGAALVQACVDQDIRAFKALQSYSPEHSGIVDRCTRDAAQFGWMLIKACVDQDISAQKALSDY